jgi:hypothetical protein
LILTAFAVREDQGHDENNDAENSNKKADRSVGKACDTNADFRELMSPLKELMACRHRSVDSAFKRKGFYVAAPLFVLDEEDEISECSARDAPRPRDACTIG